MPAVTGTSLPEQGQLVEVRQRRYVVTEVRQSTLPPDPLRIYDPTPQHRVTLSSVEDDALGEELQVIWEIEPGAQLVEGSALPQPTGFDAPHHFDAFLDAVRWGAIASADVRALQAPFRSGITIEDYQLDPVVRAIQMPRANLLIADDVVLAHLNHRLVAMALRLLRAEVWAAGGRGKLHRVTARIIPSGTLEAPALIGHARLLVLGADHQRLHEELIVAGGVLREGRFARMTLTETQRVLAAATDRSVPAPMQERLAAQWPKHQDALLAALEARMRERGESLAKFLADRAAKEVADITAILTELKRAIEAELREPSVEQLSFLSNPEREQFERNVDSLRARAARIPEEIATEAAAIRARYADPSPRLFPVAVTFLVPEQLIR